MSCNEKSHCSAEEKHNLKHSLKKSALTIEGVMHPFPHTIGAHEKLSTAQKKMKELGVRHLPVQEGGQLLGVISERDVNYFLALHQKNAEELNVSECYSEDPYVVEPSAPLRHVARRMAEDRLGCALVAREGKILGIFTTVDACRVLAECLQGSECS